MIFLTLFDVKRAISVSSFTYQLSSQFVLSLPVFLIGRIVDTQRAFRSWHDFFAYVVFEIQHFSAISRTVCHPLLSITSFLQRCYLGNIVSLQEDHPLNCPFYPKIFHVTLTLMYNLHNNVFPTD
jgi:hypothetical protein